MVVVWICFSGKWAHIIGHAANPGGLQPKEDTIMSRPTEFDRLPATFSKASHSENGELLFSASKNRLKRSFGS